KVPDVGNPPYQWFHNDREGPWDRGIYQCTKIGAGRKQDLRDRIVHLLNFPVVQRLHFSPYRSDSLLFVVVGQNVAEAFQIQYVGREFVSPQNRLEFRRGT